jgi:uncharacterized protein with FMN-binding domain
LKKAKRKIKYINIVRAAVQILSFILAPGLFIIIFSALKSVFTAIIGGSFDLSSQLPHIIILFVVFFVTIFFGRFFCGFICSFGALGDLIWFISRKLRRKPLRIGEKADTVLKSFKYLFLVFIVIAVWTFSAVSFDNSLNPWNVFGMYSSLSGWSTASGLLTAGAVLLLLIIIGSFFVERFFCRYVCPLGAAFAVASKLRLLKIRKPSINCGSCRACTYNCPAGISMYRSDKIKSGECLNCFKCVSVCPRKNAKADIGGEEVAPIAAGLTAAAAIMGLYFVGRVISENVAYAAPQTSVSDIVMSEARGNYTDGTYKGSAPGYRGITNVQVTVNKGYITDIEVLSTGDDIEFFSLAKNSVINSIISSQSASVDAVTGATYSSNAIMEAAADALGAFITVSSETPAPSPSVSQQETATAAPSVSSVPSATSAPGAYKDGTYTGTGTGFRGDTTVSVTVSGGAITNIEIVSYNDDRPYFKMASSTVISEIIASQSAQVDAVSGATFSSSGIMEAVANALGTEYTSTNTPQNGKGRSRH